jgi:hypothetical protein
VGGQLAAAEDAEDAAHGQSMISRAKAQHDREIAAKNADIFRKNAERIRNEEVRRLRESAGLDIGRLDQARHDNIERIQTDVRTIGQRIDFATDVQAERIYGDYTRYSQRANYEYSMVADRLNEDYQRISGQIVSDANTDINRISEVTNEVIRRIGRRAVETATRGFEEENDYRKELAFRVSSQRSFYAAGNVVVNTGTPASLQLDMMQQGEVQAQRIRRDYQFRVTELHESATDTARDALYQIEDIRTEANRAVEQLGIQRDRGITDAAYRRDTTLEDLEVQGRRAIKDLQVTRAWQIEDLHLEGGRQIDDINVNTDLRIADISRNLGYDVSDAMFQADQLDLQAEITLAGGEAAYAAGMNQADAYSSAGDDALTAGYLGALTTGLSGTASILDMTPAPGQWGYGGYKARVKG